MHTNTIYDPQGNKRITAQPAQVEFKEFIDFYIKNGSPASMKAKRTGIEEYYSRNPLFFLHKYVKDITKFNHDESMQSVLSSTFESLSKTQDFNTNNHKDPRIDDTLSQVYKMTKRLGADAYIYQDANTVQDAYKGYLARGAQALGYMRALSLNMRSSVKNYAGANFNTVIEYGSQHYDTFNEERSKFLSLPENKTIVDESLAKYGHLWSGSNIGFTRMVKKYARSLAGDGGIKAGSGAMVGGGAASRGTFEESLDIVGLRAIKTKDGKTGYEFATESTADKFVDFLETTAQATGVLQEMVENTVRPAVFKKLFAEAYMNYKRLPQDHLLYKMNRNIDTYTKPDKTIDYARLQKEANSYIEDQAGQAAQAGVRKTQYDYSRVNKANVLKKGLSSTILQFQHYRMENAAWQADIFKEGYRQLKAAKETGEFNRLTSFQAKRLYRLGMAQPLIHWLTTASGLGIANIVGNEVFEAIQNNVSIFTADPNTEEGQKQIQQATYNMGAATNLGITFSSIDQAMRLAGLIEDNPNGVLYRGKFTGKLNPVDFKDDNNKQAALQLFNLQIGRLATKSIPDMISGNIWRAAKYESGLYTSYETKKANEAMMRPVAQKYQDWTGIKVPLLATKRYGPNYAGKYGTDIFGKRRRNQISYTSNKSKIKKQLSPFTNRQSNQSRKLSGNRRLEALESLSSFDV